MPGEIKQVLHMKGGADDTSYAKSSYVQNQVLSLTKPLRNKAMREFYCKEQPTTTLCIADLGCSSAELNNLSLIFDLITTVETARGELDNTPQEYQIYLNDLPGNDFNTIFRSWPSFEEKLKQEMGDDFGHCFVNGVPGSFYGRLFPTNSLHFVHSSYSLHWLSQLPEGIEDNKWNVYMANTSSPTVLTAYSHQYEKDFSKFLRCRSVEVVKGGIMVLTLLGRKTTEPYSEESSYTWNTLGAALKDMVVEGLIEEEKLNSFNIPIYYPSAEELGFLVEKEGSFDLGHVDVFKVNCWETNEEQYKNSCTKSFDLNDFVKCMRSVVEPLLISHFGEAIIDDLFHRYKDNLQVWSSTTKEKNVFINITMLLTRKG